jgi:endogenous inhibitor of DNA gyrase (YacG/DUF329 family)
MREPAICRRCGIQYMPKQANRRTFCSRDCAYAHHSELKLVREVSRGARHREEAAVCRNCGAPHRTALKRIRRCGECLRVGEARTARAKSASKKAVVPRPCRKCGATFAPEYGNKRRIFCSPRCQHAFKSSRDRRMRNHRSRAKAFGARVIENFDPIEIHMRDGWTCGICLQPIARGAECPDPLSPSIDHIAPLSLGGDHSRANVRSAHFGCNSRRGNGMSGCPPKGTGYPNPCKF